VSAQLKAAYDDLVTYLGKDAKGLEKAKRLKDAANELRKKLAAAEERLKQMEAVKDAARERADAAEAARDAAGRERVAAEVETQNLSSRLSQLALKKMARETYDMEERVKLAKLVNATVDDSDISETLRVLQRLRAGMPECARQRATIDLYGQPMRIFARHDLVTGWGDEALWQLGASVALLTLNYGFIMLATGMQASVRIPRLNNGAIPPDAPLHIQAAAELSRWTMQQLLPHEDRYDLLAESINIQSRT